MDLSVQQGWSKTSDGVAHFSPVRFNFSLGSLFHAFITLYHLEGLSGEPAAPLDLNKQLRKLWVG